ncbi:hypothetical protein ZWY2020_010663 [Hordeum vulgare]|nr:hypothetical protein ZWY2020_010663 [Hordeum vulgare]
MGPFRLRFSAVSLLQVAGKALTKNFPLTDDQLPIWRKCKFFEGGSSHILNVQFGLLLSSLKMVVAYSDGQVKVYELLDSLELDKWQLQAELQNITDPVSRIGKPACISASIAWSPRRGEGQQASFAIGFSSDSPNFNSCKKLTSWLPVIELGSPEDKGERVHAVAWAPNIGRPYEMIAVATCKGIAVWRVGFNLESDGRLSTENVAVLPGHNGEV